MWHEFVLNQCIGVFSLNSYNYGDKRIRRYGLNKKEGLPKDREFRKFSISLSLDVELMLDEIQNIIKRGQGGRVSKSEIIRSAIRLIHSLSPNLAGVKDEEELYQRYLKCLKK
jgi:hypothetical protein